MDEKNLVSHMNRVRQVSHIEGQFASCLYLPVLADCTEVITSLRTDLEILFTGLHDSLGCNSPVSVWSFIDGSELHLSLSRTLFLKPHTIPSLLSKLRVRVAYPLDACIYLSDTLRLYLNDEGNTAFVGFPVDTTSSTLVMGLLGQINGVLREFDLQPFYDPPDPHVSVAFTTDVNVVHCVRQLSRHDVGRAKLSESQIDRFRIDLDSIHFRVGNTIHLL